MRCLFVLCLLTLPAHADDKILVTATRGEANAENLPFAGGTASGDRWDSAGGNPETALSGIPGLAFTSNGAPGQPRSLLIRGANAQHTLVLVDGIPVNDPLSPSRSFDFGQIPVSEIDHVEVIKGPQSVLYGSDAMGGVVQIFTKKGKASRARLEAGSYGTAKADLAAMGFRAGYFSTKGFSAADVRNGNTEADGSRNWNLGGSQDFPVTDTFLMRLNAQYNDNRTDTDKNGGAGGDSLNTYSTHSQFLLREENVILLPGEAELSVAGDYSAHDRTDNTNGSDYYKSRLWKVEAVARKTLSSHRLTVGSEFADEGGTSSQTTGGRRDFRSGGLYVQDEIDPRDGLNLVAGGRVDFHSQTETAATYRAGLSYWLWKNVLRAKASIGSGFKAPSLYQTYSSFGSLTLRPEKSIGGDAGIEVKGASWSSDLTFFANRFRDLIDFNLVTNQFFNQSRAETYGLEWQAEKRWGIFHADNSATFQRAYDPATGLLLLRRPRWSDTVEIGVSKERVYGANLLFRYVGERIDSHPVLLTRQTMPAYYTLGADIFRKLTEGIRLVGRGENLLNRNYQETSGYGVPALSAYAGIEADL
ncbi:MAG: TonB-dependent receptor plug domain-containing protein [Bdellovibrionota bacterium]